MRFFWVSRIYKFKNVFLLKNLQKIYDHVSTWPSFLPGPGKGPMHGRVGLRITLSQGQIAASCVVCAVILHFVRPLLTSISSSRKKLCNLREYVTFVHYFILLSHSRHSFVF